MKLCNHILDSMFEDSLFSDLSLAFTHATFSSTIRFDIHKAIVAQSPFFRLLLDNIDHIPLVNNNPSKQHQQDQFNTTATLLDPSVHVTINLADALKQCGFQSHGQQQEGASDGLRHILSSHIRFALKWMYSVDRSHMVKTLNNTDTLPVLCLAILFGLDGLTNDCLERYTKHQLSIYNIVHDIEIICQLPRKHKAYLQLWYCALLMLLRHGCKHPDLIARLPMDYMADVLGADSLYIGCEYERYRLLRKILAIMQSSENVSPKTAQQPNHTGLLQKLISVGGTVPDNNSTGDGPEKDTIVTTKQKHRTLSRLCFSSRIPYQRLLTPGGAINKTTILSYLLQATVKYSNMSFDQLSIVRRDGIVDEGIVFKALWQREALERQLFPLNYQNNLASTPHCDSEKEQDGISCDMINKDDTTNDQQSQQHILLDPPRFRFSASVHLTLPHDDDYDGWEKVELTKTKSTLSADATMDHSHSLDDDNALTTPLSPLPNKSFMDLNTADEQHKRGTIYNKAVYTQAEHILGHWHRVRLEAQVLPRSLLQISDDAKVDETDHNSSVLVCRFELQRDNDGQDTTQAPQPTMKIRYAIHCLNWHEGLVKNDRVDPEDWMLVPVTEVTESTHPSTGYVGQILLDTLNKDAIHVDMMVVLEIVAFEQCT